MSPYQYRNSHYKGKTVSQQSYLNNFDITKATLKQSSHLPNPAQRFITCYHNNINPMKIMSSFNWILIIRLLQNFAVTITAQLSCKILPQSKLDESKINFDHFEFSGAMCLLWFGADKPLVFLITGQWPLHDNDKGVWLNISAAIISLNTPNMTDIIAQKNQHKISLSNMSTMAKWQENNNKIHRN